MLPLVCVRSSAQWVTACSSCWRWSSCSSSPAGLCRGARGSLCSSRAEAALRVATAGQRCGGQQPGPWQAAASRWGSFWTSLRGSARRTGRCPTIAHTTPRRTTWSGRRSSPSRISPGSRAVRPTHRLSARGKAGPCHRSWSRTRGRASFSTSSRPRWATRSARTSTAGQLRSWPPAAAQSYGASCYSVACSSGLCGSVRSR
mmetsp:Transcript_93737/g.248852  ORF Transcript_93737/g.248852 Transcript_93737/m.248852 type:complete len:202 (+) Transcript_93737:717-1322(+)